MGYPQIKPWSDPSSDPVADLKAVQAVMEKASREAQQQASQATKAFEKQLDDLKRQVAKQSARSMFGPIPPHRDDSSSSSKKGSNNADVWWEMDDPDVIDDIDFDHRHQRPLRDLLDPGDTYPFYEWEDMTLMARHVYLMGRLTHRNQAEGLMTATERIMRLDDRTEVESEIIKYNKRSDSSQDPFQARETNAGSDWGTRLVPAQGSHLERAIALSRDRHARKHVLISKDPVPAWTLISGDRLATNADMITGCTIQDSEPFKKKDGGKVNVLHRTRFVNYP